MSMDPGAPGRPLLSPETCRVWLATLPAADPVAFANAIVAALDELPDPGSMNALKVLEALRQPALQVQEALATRYTDKLLPLSPQQSGSLQCAVRLARKLADSLSEGLAACMADTGEYGRLAPLVHQRIIFWAVQAMLNYLRARQRVPDELWNIAQNVLASAGRAGILDKLVRDSMHPDGRTSVSSAYVRGLLLHMCGARSLAARELEYSHQIAFAFDRKVAFAYRSRDGSGESGGAVPAGEGTKFRELEIGRLHHTLDVAALAKSVGGRLTELNRGGMFETPVLTPTPTPTALRPLFGKLYAAWCSRTNLRKFPRRHRSEAIFFAVDPELMYGLMKRRPYIAPPPPKLYSHVEVANIFLEAADVSLKDELHTPESWQQMLAVLDCWQLVEESASGLSMQRGANSGNAKVKRGQLAAIRHGAQGTAMIGEIRWAEETGDGRVEVGLEMLPGLARAGAARYAEAASIMSSTGKSPSTAALILDNFRRSAPAARDNREQAAEAGPTSHSSKATQLPSIDEDMLNKTGALTPLRGYTEQATILLPVGWAREGNIIEFIDGAASLRMKLRAIASRHGEFERMFFEIAQ